MTIGDKQYLRDQLQIVIMICVHEKMSAWRSVYETMIIKDTKIVLNPLQKEELYQELEKIICNASIASNQQYDKLKLKADEYVEAL